MIRKQLHILILPSWYPISSMPLSGIFFKEQVQALRRAGVKAGIVYPETRGLTNFTLKNLLDNHFHITKELEDSVMTFRLHSWNMFPKIPKLQAVQWIYETKRLVKRYIEINGKPDVIHAHSALWGGYTAFLLAKEYNIPYIITEHHSNFANGLIKEWQVPYIQKSFVNAKKLIAVSSPFAKILQHYDKGKKIVVIPNAINTDFFYFKKKSCKEKFTYLFVAFLHPQKGADILIRAFAKAYKGNNKFVLKIGGDGKYRRQLEKLACELDVRTQVEFLGSLNREQVREQLWNSNVLVLPSYYETFGVVLIESLSSGTPIISTNSGGPVDIVRSDVGILFNPGNVSQLSEALVDLYKNYDLYDPCLIRKYAVDNFSDKIITEKLIDVYKEVLNLKSHDL